MPAEKSNPARLNETLAADINPKDGVTREGQTDHHADLRQQIERAFSGPESEIVVSLAGPFELLIGKTADRAVLHLFQAGREGPLWSKEYARKKCAIKGVLRTLEQRGIVASDTGSDLCAPAVDEISEDKPQAVTDKQRPTSVWTMVPTAYKYATTLTGNGTEVTVNVIPAGLDSYLVEMTWEGRRLVREFGDDWSAKSEALKMANRLVEWAN
ncbi:hypothetical protein [Sinorhizobium fredii]|uniref:hypothetical protein n=1 Tax=Rhizobium fredii TaxID=380 RepID=UPI0033950D38